MGLYDPEFKRKTFIMPLREGEVPGSIVLGAPGSKSKGCVWPGQNGKWFAATPNHPVDQPYRSFENREAAVESLLAPMRLHHEARENEREHAWKAAAPRRAARAERSKIRETKRLNRKRKKTDKVWRVMDAEGQEIGRVVRPFPHEAMIAAASLLGFSKLPSGYDIESVD